jgi:hypothetical protein
MESRSANEFDGVIGKTIEAVFNTGPEYHIIFTDKTAVAIKKQEEEQ